MACRPSDSNSSTIFIVHPFRTQPALVREESGEAESFGVIRRASKQSMLLDMQEYTAAGPGSVRREAIAAENT
jgi:hypothetical protein